MIEVFNLGDSGTSKYITLKDLDVYNREERKNRMGLEVRDRIYTFNINI